MNRIIVVALLVLIGVLPIKAQCFDQEFKQVQESFDLRVSNARKSINSYLQEYPYTPYEDEVRTMQAVLLNEKGKHKQAIKTMQKVKVKHLSRTITPLYYFHLGYAYFKQGDYDNALKYLQTLKTKDNPYYLQATYYIGCCNYSKKEYAKALVDFLSLEHIGGYRQIAPYYIVQINYATSQYDQVKNRAETLLNDFPDNEYNDELHRMLGEIYYQDSLYEQATTHLEAYYKLRNETKKNIVRNDLYLLGISNYKIKKYNEAIQYLKQVKQDNDSISESTFLHLGHSYLRIDNLEQAKLAYAAAIQINQNPVLREEAMYNYTQITYLQNSALGESITAFQMFLKEYPNSKYIDKIYALMADLYLNSKNYTAALNALLEIQNPNEQVLQTRQYLRYQLAVDAFLQNKMSDVLKWTNEVIANEPNESTYKTEAYYLSAQALYHTRQYQTSLTQLGLYEHQKNVATSKNKNIALYLKAYALFNLKDFAAAEPILRAYIALIDSGNKTYADAQNRLGDCLFQSRRFQEAIDIYAKVIDLNLVGVDYAILQQGIALGLLHRYPEKIAALQTLHKDYPRSDYADDALYEIARAQLQQEQPIDAATAYQTLLTTYPNSNYAIKASLELGMTYRTLKKYDESIAAFKTTISMYEGTEEAYSALENLEHIYVETNNINEYIAYTKTLKNMNQHGINSEDSLIYVTAELQYMMGNYQQAAAGLTTYLTTFCPGGRYCMTATYYAANSFYQLQQYEQAIEQYSALIEIQGNPYMEEACMRVAELSYDKKEYHTALYYFQRMNEVVSSTNNRITALLGILRCEYNTANYISTINAASRLLEETSIDSLVRNEAMFCRAKAYLQKKQYDSAKEDLKLVAKEVRTAQGAEAKYLLAQCYYNIGELNAAEQEIMSFTQQKTSQQYWLAKCFILLADINITRNELFQAKQYLLALQSNYHVQDDIQTAITNKLQHIAQLENTQATDSTQIQQL